MGDLDRQGAVLPLAHDAKNTKEQSWNELTFDYYPDKEACDADFLYEDDGETTAYRQGEFRIGEYEAKYDRKENAYVIRFAASEGSFAGKRACTMRKAAVRVHSCGRRRGGRRRFHRARVYGFVAVSRNQILSCLREITVVPYRECCR